MRASSSCSTLAMHQPPATSSPGAFPLTDDGELSVDRPMKIDETERPRSNPAAKRVQEVPVKPTSPISSHRIQPAIGPHSQVEKITSKLAYTSCSTDKPDSLVKDELQAFKQPGRYSWTIMNYIFHNGWKPMQLESENIVLRQEMDDYEQQLRSMTIACKQQRHQYQIEFDARLQETNENHNQNLHQLKENFQP